MELYHSHPVSFHKIGAKQPSYPLFGIKNTLTLYQNQRTFLAPPVGLATGKTSGGRFGGVVTDKAGSGRRKLAIDAPQPAAPSGAAGGTNDIYDCAGRPGEKQTRNGAPGVPTALGKRFCGSKRAAAPAFSNRDVAVRVRQGGSDRPRFA